MTTTTLHAMIGYRDAPAALDWLAEVLGFTTVARFPADGPVVHHAESRRGDAVLLLFTDEAGYERPPQRGDTCGLGLYLAVDDEAVVAEVWDKALARGATGVWKPESTEWNHRCRVVDPQGVEWTVGTYRPGNPW